MPRMTSDRRRSSPAREHHASANATGTIACTLCESVRKNNVDMASTNLTHPSTNFDRDDQSAQRRVISC